MSNTEVFTAARRRAEDSLAKTYVSIINDSNYAKLSPVLRARIDCLRIDAELFRDHLNSAINCIENLERMQNPQ